MNKIVKVLFGLSVSALLASCGCSATEMSVSFSPSSEHGGGSSNSSSDSTGTSSDTTPSTSSDSSASSDTSQTSTEPVVKYTLTFDSKGGSAITVQTIDAGGKFTRPTDPTKEGYDFAGWYKEDTYQNAFDFNAEVTANVTIYAKWTEKATPTVQYTITFDSKGGSAVAAQTIEAGEKFSIPDDPTKEGYDFAGWYKEEAYENEFDFNAEVTASVTVYAKWTAQVTHYVLTFVTGEGASSIAAQTIDEGQKFTKPANPTKQGYDFAGWYQDAEYQSEFDFDADVTADVTIYAKWTEHITVYSYALAKSGNNWEAEAMTKIDDPEKLPAGFDYAYAVGNGVVKLAENEAFRIEAYEDGTKVDPYGSQATIIEGSSYVTADEDHNLVIKAAGNYVIALFHSEEDGFGIVILESEDIYAYTIGEKTGNMTYHIEDDDLRYEARNIEAKAGDAVSFTLNGEPFAYQTESEFLDNDGKVIADGTYTFTLLQNGTLLVNKEVLYTAKAGDQDLEFNAYKNEENTQIIVERTKLEAGLTISFTADGQPIEFEIDQASAAFFENGATASKGMYSFTLTISDEGNSLMVQFVPITGVYGYKVGEGEEQPLTMNEFSSYEVYEAEGVKFKKGDQLTFLKDGVAYPIEFNEKDIFSPYYFKEGVIQFDGTYEISLAIGEEKGSLTIFRTDKAADNIIATINGEIADLSSSKIEDIGEHDIAGYSIDLAKGETIKFYMAGLSYDIYETLGDEVVYYQDAFEAPYTAKYNFYLDDEGAWNVKLANTPTTTITATANEQAAELVNAQVSEGNRAVFTIDLKAGDMLTLFDGGEEMMFYVYNQETDRVYPDSTLYSAPKDGTYTIYVNDNVQRRVWIVLTKEKVTYSYKFGEEGEPVILDKNNSKEGVDLSGNKQIAFSVEAKQGDVFILNAGDEAYGYSVEGEEGILDENFAFVEDGKYDVYFKYEIGKIYIAEHPAERVLGILVDGEAQEIAPEEDPGNNKAVYKIDLEKDAVLTFEMDGDPILMHIVGGEEEPLDELTVVNPGQYIIYWNTKDEIWVQIPASESAEYSYYLKNSGDWSTPIALEEIEEPLDGYDAVYEFEGNLGTVEFGIEVHADDAFETWLASGRQFLNPLTGDISDTNELVEVAQNNLKLKAEGYYAIGVAVKVVDGERNYYLIVMEGEDHFEPYDIEKLGITVNEVEVADLESYPDPKYRQQAHGTIASAEAEDILTFFYEGEEIPDYLIEANSDPNNNLIVEDGFFKLRAGGTNLDVYFQVIGNDEFTVWVSGYTAPTPVEKVDLWVRGTAVGGWETIDENQLVESQDENNFGELTNVHLGLGEFKLGNEDYSIEYNWYNYKSGGTNFAKVDGEGSDIRVLVPGVYNIYAEAGTVGEGKHGLYIVLVEADEKISIAYESNGGSVVASEEVYPTQSFEEPDEPERLGYEFKGWFLDDGTFEEEFDFSEPQDDDVIVYAKWDVITYTIGYELGEGGVNAQGNPDSYNIESEEIELADPTKENHRFVGWYSDEDRTVPVEGVITTGSTGNKVFYAKFVDASLKTVTFVTGEGASLVAEGTAENGTPFTRPENNPTRPGYTFVDWYEKEGEVYAAQPYDFSTNASADLTLYAKWEIINYTITYHLGVGETNNQNNPASYTIITETSDLLPATKEDYEFGGWFLDQECTEKVESIVQGHIGNVDLYPLWLQATEYYIRGTSVSGWDIAQENVLYKYSVGTDKGIAMGIELYQGEFKIADEGWTNGKIYGWNKLLNTCGAYANFSEEAGDNIRCNVDGRYNVYLTNNGYISIEFVEALPARPITYGINHAGSGNWPMSENLSPVELSPAEQETLEAKCQIDIALAQNEEFGVKISNGAQGWYSFNNIGDEASKEFVRKADGQNDNIVAKTADTYHIVVTRAKNGDVKIYISLVKNVVTLDIDGNTDTKIVLSVGESLTQPDDPAPKTGHTFVGWFEASEGGEPLVFPLAINADKTIYARYAANEYRVVFHENDGSGEMADLLFTYDGEQHALTANAFTRDYYSFVKWNTQANGQGTDYADKSTYALLPSMTIDLYAQWTPVSYTITYDLKGGELAEANPTQYTVVTPTFELHNPAKDNYNFTGWYDEGDHRVESITIGSHGNLNLTAKWSEKYVLTFHNADVESVEENNEHKFVRPDDPTKTGYEFVNWYKEEGLVNPFDFSLTVSANGDAYAKWSAISYTVTLDDQGGSGGAIDGGKATYGSDMPALAIPTRVGYTFKGYFTEPAGAGTKYYNQDGTSAKQWDIANNVTTLYAKWTVNEYTITYNLYGGHYANEQSNVVTYTVESNDINLLPVEKANYEFIGWKDHENPSNIIAVIPHGSYGDLVLDASFNALTTVLSHVGVAGDENWEAAVMQDDSANITDSAVAQYKGIVTVNDSQSIFITYEVGSDVSYKKNDVLSASSLSLFEADGDGNIKPKSAGTYEFLLKVYEDGEHNKSYSIVGNIVMIATVGETPSELVDTRTNEDYANRGRYSINLAKNDVVSFGIKNGASLDIRYYDDSTQETTVYTSQNPFIAPWDGDYVFWYNGAGQIWVNIPAAPLELANRSVELNGWADNGHVIYAHSWKGSSNYDSVMTDSTIVIIDNCDGLILVDMPENSQSLDWNEKVKQTSDLPYGSGVLVYSGGSFNWVQRYTVTWKSEDGNSTLDTDVVDSGAQPLFAEATPTKEQTAQYTYSYHGWSTEPNGEGTVYAYDALPTVSGNVTYYVNFQATTRKYTITWLQDDESLIGTTNVDYGAIPTHADPEKASSAQNSYSFAGWTPAIVAVSGAATYTATYNSTVNQYAVRFVNYDGTELQVGNLDYGAMPAYVGETPTKAATAQYSYTFAGWDKEIVAVTGAVTYTATYNSNVRSYSVTWKSEDGKSVLETDPSVQYGSEPSYGGEAQTKAATAQYTYTFAGWSTQPNGQGTTYAAGNLPTVSGTTTYYAWFTSTVNQYLIKFVNYDEQVLQSGLVDYGTIPTYNGETPAKDGETFTGWSPEITNVTGAATYTATFTPLTVYSVAWYQDDGETLIDNTDVIDGNHPTHANASKEDPQYTYTFLGWALSKNGDVVNLGEITISQAGVKFYAVYESHVRSYSVTWKSEDGKSVLETDPSVQYGSEPSYGGEAQTKAATAQYTYTFAGWSTQPNGQGTTYAAGNLPTVSGTTTYYAWFTSTVNQYQVRFVDYDGTELQVSNLDYGSMPSYNGETPTRAATAQYTYTFAGWSPTLAEVSGTATYTATYNSTVNKYTVTWKNGESVLETDENVPYGSMPTYDGDLPTKAADDFYTYTHSWTPEVGSVTGNAEYQTNWVQHAKTYYLSGVLNGSNHVLENGDEFDAEVNVVIPLAEGAKAETDTHVLFNTYLHSGDEIKVVSYSEGVLIDVVTNPSSEAITLSYTGYYNLYVSKDGNLYAEFVDSGVGIYLRGNALKGWNVLDGETAFVASDGNIGALLNVYLDEGAFAIGTKDYSRKWCAWGYYENLVWVSNGNDTILKGCPTSFSKNDSGDIVCNHAGLYNIFINNQNFIYIYPVVKANINGENSYVQSEDSSTTGANRGCFKISLKNNDVIKLNPIGGNDTYIDIRCGETNYGVEYTVDGGEGVYTFWFNNSGEIWMNKP